MMFKIGFQYALEKFAARIPYEDVADAYAAARAAGGGGGLAGALRPGIGGGAIGGAFGAGMGALDHAVIQDDPYTLKERMAGTAAAYGLLGAGLGAHAGYTTRKAPSAAFIGALRAKHPGASDRDLLRALHPDRLGHAPPEVSSLAEEAYKRVTGAGRTHRQ